MVTVTSLQLVIMEGSIHQLTAHHGHNVPLVIRIISMGSPMETALSWELVVGIMLDQLTLRVGLLRILLIMNGAIIWVSPTAGAVLSWVLVNRERSLDQLTVVHLSVLYVMVHPIIQVIIVIAKAISKE